MIKLKNCGKIFLCLLATANLYPSFAASPDDQPAVWGDYCDSYLPCAMVSGTAEISAIGINRIEKIKTYFSNFGKKSAMSESEFKYYLSTLIPSQRKKLVSVCINKRGYSSKEFCEKSYLLDHEIAEIYRSSSKPISKLEEYNYKRAYLLREDDRLYQELKIACPNSQIHCSIGSSLEADLIKLNRDVNTFNNNSEAIQKLGRIESKTISERLIAYEFTELSLSPRILNTAVNDKNLENQISLKKSNKVGFKDPYAGVSNQISQDSIEQNSNSLYQLSMAVSKVANIYIESQINSNIALGNANQTPTQTRPQAERPAQQASVGSQDELIASLKAHAIPECVNYQNNRFYNVCNFDIEIVFCINNPTPFDKAPLTDAGAAYDCAKNQGGLWTIDAGNAMAGTFSGERATYSACKRPFSPVKIKGPGGQDYYACK